MVVPGAQAGAALTGPLTRGSRRCWNNWTTSSAGHTTACGWPPLPSVSVPRRWPYWARRCRSTRCWPRSSRTAVGSRSAARKPDSAAPESATGTMLTSAGMTFCQHSAIPPQVPLSTLWIWSLPVVSTNSDRPMGCALSWMWMLHLVLHFTFLPFSLRRCYIHPTKQTPARRVTKVNTGHFPHGGNSSGFSQLFLHTFPLRSLQSSGNNDPITRDHSTRRSSQLGYQLSAVPPFAHLCEWRRRTVGRQLVGDFAGNGNRAYFFPLGFTFTGAIFLPH